MSSPSPPRTNGHHASFTLSSSSGRGSDTDTERVNRMNASTTASTEPIAIPSWASTRHLTCGNPAPNPPWSSKTLQWRSTSHSKLKTANAALVLCLNIDVDPPDVVKTSPCANLECWVDPHSMPAEKAIEAIGMNLQHQYEGLSLRITYKNILDPSYEDLRRFCITLRKQAKEDTVIFHYNGHGVPKPTASGELWCFNRNYTQYIPVSLQELQGWLGSPVVYIWDCSAAGHLLQNFNGFAQRRDSEVNLMHGGYAFGTQPFMNSLQLAACSANEQLPTCPELPADVFTSCLTSPIDIALRFFVMNHQLPNNINVDMVMQVPGDLKDRKTPLGELNWIFTAITDTIAWTTFPRPLFTRLYRSDILIASLFRNFLLAERILKNYKCTPHTYPPLPPTNIHPMWSSWDLAVDACLRQLPDLLFKTNPTSKSTWKPGLLMQISQTQMGPSIPHTYVPSRFFADQLTAFEVWISRGGSALTKRGPMSLPIANGIDRCTNGDSISEEDVTHQNYLVPRKPPDQLPIVLQVLLCQPHRLRALILLSQFVDLGPWAVHLVLTTGIFPYISRLLLAPNQDLRPVLIFIWARILAVDPSVQTDLCNSQNYKYFSNVLASKEDATSTPGLPNPAEHKAMCAFILAAISRDFAMGQNACQEERVFDHCVERFDVEDFLLRQWVTICVGNMWDGNDDIRVYAVDKGVQDALIKMLIDHSVEVRCAVLYTLGTFLGASASADPEKRGGGGSGTMWQLQEREHFRMEVGIGTAAMVSNRDDCSPMARKELLVLLSCLVKEWRGHFVVAAWLYWEENRRYRTGAASHQGFHDEDITGHAIADWLDAAGDDEYLQNRVLLTSFFTMFVTLLELSVDPYPEVAANAQTVMDYIMALLLESPFTKLEGSTLAVPKSPIVAKPSTRSRAPSLQSSPSTIHNVPASQSLTRPTYGRSDTMTSSISEGVSKTIKRTSSFANTLKNLAGGIVFPSSEDLRLSSLAPAQTIQAQTDATTATCPPPNLNLARYAPPYSEPPTDSSTLYSEPASPVESPESPTDFLPCDVMEALMEEDLERLRARRKHRSRKPHSQRGQSSDSLPSPSSSTFSMDSTTSSVILGLGTGAGVQDNLPLKSTYFDWCCEYFREPQMRQQEQDEPGSIQYNYQVWRQQRNEQVLRETRSHLSAAQSSPWNRPVATLHVSGVPLNMAFHSYDQHVVVANDTDTISVWNWSQKRRLSQFHNGNPVGSSITSIQIINEDVGGIIMTGTSEGIVRLYRNYDDNADQGPVQLVSAFRAFNDVIPVKQGSGMVMDWRQAGGYLSIAGDSQCIRVWEANTEALVAEMSTCSDSPVTGIASDPLSSSIIAACFADGEVKMFDKRLPYEEPCIRRYAEHSTCVHNVRWHPSARGQCLSASMDGEVKLWDMRASGLVDSWKVFPKGISAFDVHSQANVYAAASSITPGDWRSQRVAVYAIGENQPLSIAHLSTGLTSHPLRLMPSPYIPRTSSLSFHPTEMLYGVGEPDGSVRILGCKLV